MALPKGRRKDGGSRRPARQPRGGRPADAREPRARGVGGVGTPSDRSLRRQDRHQRTRYATVASIWTLLDEILTAGDDVTATVTRRQRVPKIVGRLADPGDRR